LHGHSGENSQSLAQLLQAMAGTLIQTILGGEWGASADLTEKPGFVGTGDRFSIRGGA